MRATNPQSRRVKLSFLIPQACRIFMITPLFACLPLWSSLFCPPDAVKAAQASRGVRGGVELGASSPIFRNPAITSGTTLHEVTLNKPLCIAALKSRGPLKVCFWSPPPTAITSVVPPILNPPSPNSGQKTECDVSSPSPHKAPVHWTHLGQHKGRKARWGLDTQDHAAKPDKDASKVERRTVAFFSSALHFFFPGPSTARGRKKEKHKENLTKSKDIFVFGVFTRVRAKCNFLGNSTSERQEWI